MAIVISTSNLKISLRLALQDQHRAWIERHLLPYQSELRFVDKDADLEFVDDPDAASGERSILIHTTTEIDSVCLESFVDFCTAFDNFRLPMILRREIGTLKASHLRETQRSNIADRQIFRQTFETNQAIKLLIDPISGQLIDANQSACRFYGYEKAELLKLRISDINVLTEPEVKAEMRRAQSKSQLFFRFKHRLKNGEIREVEVYSGPVQMDDRTVLFSIIVDVSAREYALAALETSMKNFKALFEHNPDGMILADAQAAIQDINHVGLTLIGYERKEALSLTLRELWADQDKEHGSQAFKRVASGEVVRTEQRIRRFDGEIIDVEIHAKQLPDGRLLGLVRDLTQQKIADAERLVWEEHLRQSQKLESIGRLAGGIAHDMNNLLSPIMGYAELGSMRQTPQEKDHAFKRIMEAADRAKELTTRLLAFSRKQVLDRKNLQLNTVIERFVSLMHRIIGEDIAMQLDLAKDLPLIFADPGQLEQVVLNLVINARDALAEGGEIRIATSSNRLGDLHYVTLAVTDDGIGMQPDVLKRALEPFFTTKNETKGTGLGLAVVHGIVSQHEGRVEIESTPGYGSSIKITFPASTGEEHIEPQMAPQEIDIRGNEHLVIVEDDPTVQSFLEEGLRQQGYRIDAFGDPRAMLHWLSRTPKPEIDLIITDVVMPSMRGPALIQAIRERIGPIRALLISGYPEAANFEHVLKSKYLSFLRKPFTITKLLREVRKLLGDEIE